MEGRGRERPLRLARPPDPLDGEDAAGTGPRRRAERVKVFAWKLPLRSGRAGRDPGTSPGSEGRRRVPAGGGSLARRGAPRAARARWSSCAAQAAAPTAVNRRKPGEKGRGRGGSSRLALARRRPPTRTPCSRTPQPGAAPSWSGRPGRVVLRFNERVEIAFGSVRVFDGRGDRVDAGSTRNPADDPRPWRSELAAVSATAATRPPTG